MSAASDGTGTNRTLMVEPARLRTVGQLWQYCGHGAPARRTRGMSADDLAAHGSPLLRDMWISRHAALAGVPS